MGTYNYQLQTLLFLLLQISFILLLNTTTGSSSTTTTTNNHHPNAYNETFSEDADYLRVLNLNTWGLTWPWSTDREYRFRALRDEIIRGNYDIVLLQEVWFRYDYDLIRKALPYVTYYRTLNANCFGKVLPIGCSGLAILSKHPIEHVQLHPFTYRGTFWNFDGEIFVGKGVGQARIRWRGYTVDVFTTHLISYTYHPNRDNTLYRYMQAIETVKHIRESDADIKLFGGDINALPLTGPRQPYTILTSVLTDSLTDKYPGASFHPWFSTFGNERNTYTRSSMPERIDYLMYASASHIKMKTYDYITPVIMTKSGKGKVISVSDHEPILCVYIIERRRDDHLPSIEGSDNSFINEYPSKQDISHVESNDLSIYS